MKKNRPILERILEQCLLVPETGCLEFQGDRVRGYGRIYYKGKTRRAHVLVFVEKHGYQPPMVCHNCDKPPCCNDAHLFAGDAKTNASDRESRGRHVGARKLTLIQLSLVRSAEKSYGYLVKLAKDLNVSKTLIVRARSGITYRGVGSGPAA